MYADAMTITPDELTALLVTCRSNKEVWILGHRVEKLILALQEAEAEKYELVQHLVDSGCNCCPVAEYTNDCPDEEWGDPDKRCGDMIRAWAKAEAQKRGEATP